MAKRRLNRHRDAILGRIVSARDKKGVSQRELGGVLGLDQSAISKIERGNRNLDLYEFILLCDYLEIELKDLRRVLALPKPSYRRRKL